VKAALKAIGFIGLLVAAWFMVKERKARDFKSNLPQVATAPASPQLPPNISPKKLRMPLKHIPLAKAGDFVLNQTFQPQTAALYSWLFDTLQLTALSAAQLQSSSVLLLDAATVIQLHVFHRSVVSPNPENREAALLMAGIQLESAKEANYFIGDYLMADRLWLQQMRGLHYRLMQQPHDAFLNRAFLTLLQPASGSHTLDYLEQVQYLYRGPTDEYFQVNPEILERFDAVVLKALLDKVNDYHWWAAYPERDAEQGILEILEGRGEK